jgi:hypothetical protein
MRFPSGFTFVHDDLSSLSRDEQYLCQAIYQLAKENGKFACIAGSFPLTEILKQKGITSFKSNDVDIFTTLSLNNREIREMVGIVEAQTRDSFIEWRNNPNLSDFENYSTKGNLRGVTDFRIRTKLNQDGWHGSSCYKGFKIQLISIVDNMSSIDSQNETSTDFATRTINLFDINICKCAIPNLFEMRNITTPSISDILTHKMEYDMRRFASAEVMWNRITKYLNRGFTFIAIRFDDNKIILADKNQFRPLINGFGFGVAMVDDSTTSTFQSDDESDNDVHDAKLLRLM